MSNLKIRIQQINTIVGDLKGNVDRVLSALQDADSAGMDLIVLQELVTCGYPPADLLERQAFKEAIYSANERIIEATTSIKTAVLFGTVIQNEKFGRSVGNGDLDNVGSTHEFSRSEGFGRPIYNAAILADGGKVHSITRKTLLPTYDIFDELRYFEPNTEFEIVEFRGLKLGVTICEDIWNADNEIIYHRYTLNPSAILKSLGAEVLVNVSASPFSKRKAEVRLRMLRNHAIEGDIPIIYANAVGANTEVLFDGDSMVMDRRGEIVVDTKMFQDSFADVIWDATSKEFQALSVMNGREKSDYARMFNALRMGICDYFEKSRLTGKVVLGLSGGIDSALVAVLAAESVGAQNVTALTMPSMFSSEGSVKDSEKLATSLGITLHEVHIREAYDALGGLLQPMFEGTPFGLAEENLQSRIRGVLLMGMSNKFGSILLNTGNKSELAVGYCTLYGDMNGGLSVISDLYKSEVYGMCEWLNDVYFGREVIPRTIITKPPSAELRPDQKDSDSLPEYDVLDGILALYIEEQRSISYIIEQGYDAETVKKVVRLVDFAEFKRRQSPPGLRLSAKAFGIGRRLPIVQQWTNQ